MAWTTPATAVVNTVAAASTWNSTVRDNLAYLKTKDAHVESGVVAWTTAGAWAEVTIAFAVAFVAAPLILVSGEFAGDGCVATIKSRSTTGAVISVGVPGGGGLGGNLHWYAYEATP